MGEITTEMTVAALGAMFFLYIGIQLILNARQGRDFVVACYRKYPRLYRAFFFGDWIANRPQLHIWLIRLGGVWAILMATILFLAIFLHAARS